MKKTLTVVAVSALLAVSASAQNMYDAITFAQTNYQGTARTMAMGNAVTAIGGDLGSVTINPAGSAVAGYSQVTITPSVSLISTISDYAPVFGKDATSSNNDSYSRMMLPNIGFTFDYKTGNRHGVKNVAFGMVANVNNDYTMTSFAQGTNVETTYLGALAANATGYNASSLGKSDAYFNSHAPWNVITGYQGGMISPYGGSQTDYIGATEFLSNDNVISLAGPITQIYGAQTHGSKYDLVFNVGVNINDVWYLGANLGVASISYQHDNYFKEIAQNPNDFTLEYDTGAVINFTDARSRYSYNAEGAGAYLKVGAIFRPTSALRIGAAVQTPTLMTIDERFVYASDTHFTNNSFDGSAISPDGEYSYLLRSPFRANAGIAYNIGGRAMISADYELADYRAMQFRDIEGYIDSFINENRDIQDYTGLQHMVRIGVEVKPLPELAFRAGYNLTTSPEYRIDDMNIRRNVKANTNSISFGMGYSSPGSFFADVAYKLTETPTAFIQPYSDYIDDIFSPEIRTNSLLHNIVATIGFRF